jgi:hypothetical protein
MSLYSPPKTVPESLESLLHAVGQEDLTEETTDFIDRQTPETKKKEEEEEEEYQREMLIEEKLVVDETSSSKKERNFRKKRKERNSLSMDDDSDWRHNIEKKEEGKRRPKTLSSSSSIENKKRKSSSTDESQVRKAREILEKLRLPFTVSPHNEQLIPILVKTYDAYYQAFPNFKYTLLTWKANNSQLAIRHIKKKKKNNNEKNSEDVSTLTILSDDNRVYYMVFDNEDNEEEEPFTSVKDIRQRLLESWKCTYAIENKGERPKKPYPSSHEQLSYLVGKKSKDITIKKYNHEDDALASGKGSFFLVYRLKKEDEEDEEEEEEASQYHWFANNITSHYDKVQLVIVPKQHTGSKDDLEAFASFLDARDNCIRLLTKGPEEVAAVAAVASMTTTTVEEDSLSTKEISTNAMANLQVSPKSLHFLEILEDVVKAYSDKQVAEERLILEKEKVLFEKEKEEFLKEKEKFDEKKRRLSNAISLM